MSMILINAHSYTILVFPFFSKVPSLKGEELKVLKRLNYKCPLNSDIVTISIATGNMIGYHITGHI